VALRILIVEDHADTRRTLAGLLANVGHTISVADSKQTAFDEVGSKQFDVVLSDINLPDGTGCDVISEAKRKQSLSGVAITGLSASEEVRRGKEAGFDYYLTKPLNFEKLRDILSNLESQLAFGPLPAV
jgi:DNA-binding response OmpR family regulator